MRILRFLVVLGTALLAGCASTTLTTEQTARLRKVGVVSLVPQETRIQKIGITVFNNERTRRPFGDSINEAVERTMLDELRRLRPTMAARRVAADRGPLLEAAASWNPLLDSGAARARPQLMEVMKRESFDGLVVVTEYAPGDRFDTGVGILMRATDEITSVRAHSILYVSVMDSKGELLAERLSVANEALPEPQKYDYKLEKNLTDGIVATFGDTLRRVVTKQAMDNVKQLGL